VSPGGSTQFEYIQAVTLTRQPGEILRVQVDVFIANPTGCTSGNPCPEYDDSPEAVNVWIDWNGDQAWAPAEQVLDQFGTGYLNINYSGTMTFIQDVPIPPTHVASTYLRANLGWGFDPNDPCDPGWTWGNVYDMPVQLEKVGVLAVASSGTETPIEGVADPIWETSFGPAPQCDLNPPTRQLPFAGGFAGPGPTLDVTLDACPARPAYTPRVEYQWVIPTTAVPWADRTGSGTFTGWTGQVPLTLPSAVGKTSVELTFDIFDDLGNRVATQQKVVIDPLYVGLDRALAPVSVPKIVWLDKATGWARGGYTPTSIGSRLVTGIFGNGGWQYQDPAVSWVGLVEGTGTRGNCYTMSNMWDAMARMLGVPGTGVAPTTGSTGRGFVTRPGHAASFDPAQAGNAHPQAGAIDRWMFGSHQVGSLGGSYYDPTFNNEFAPLDAFILWNITGAAAVDVVGTYLPAELGHRIYVRHTLPPWGDWEFRPATVPLARPLDVTGASALAATFQGPYAWTTVDANGDGRAEALRLAGNINLTGAGVPGDFSYLGSLAAGVVTVTSRPSSTAMGLSGGAVTSAGAGLHPFTVDFSGEDIRTSALNGPFQAHLVVLGAGGVFMDSVTTSSPAYAPGSFGEHATQLGTATSAGVDDNSNGLFDRLRVQVPVTAFATTAVAVSVALTAPGDAAPLEQAATQATLAAGSHVLAVSLDGRPIRARGVNGPFALSIQLAEATLPVESRAATTAAYLSSQFETPSLVTTGTASDTALDLNANGTFDELRVSVPINASLAGNYQSSASLWKGSTLVSSSSVIGPLGTGPGSLGLRFRGSDLSSSGLNGPYVVRNLRVSDPGGALGLALDSVLTTSAYLASQFDLVLAPLVSLTGLHSSAAFDSNSNGKFDELRYTTGVVATLSGNVVASAFLHAPSGELIGHSTAAVAAVAGVPTSITLSFDGRRIYGKAENGPFQVRNLLVYQTGDPTRSVQLAAAHTTASYLASAFEPAPVVFGRVSLHGSSPIANALVALDPLQDYDYSNPGGDYRVVLQGGAVTVSLASVPGYPDDSWSVLVGGSYVGTGRTATVTPLANEAIRVDFVTGSPLGVEPVGTPHRSSLSLASPNPARIGSQVRLRYTLGASGAPSATVFDVHGRPVRRLGGSNPVAGEFVWDGRNDRGAPVSPGVYVVRLDPSPSGGAGGATSQKVVLVR
jgi:hypothetical protein